MLWNVLTKTSGEEIEEKEVDMVDVEYTLTMVSNGDQESGKKRERDHLMSVRSSEFLIVEKETKGKKKWNQDVRVDDL